MNPYMPRHRSIIRVGLTGILAALVAVALPSCNEPAPEGKRVGDSSPQIHGTDVDGKKIKLSDYKGKVVLVNFWGTWCFPCRALIPHERKMVEKKYAGRPFVLLGVAADPPERLREFLKSNPLPWPNIADGNPGIISKQWGVQAYPSALLVDHNGVILERWLSGMNPTEVWNEVEEAVRAAEK